MEVKDRHWRFVCRCGAKLDFVAVAEAPLDSAGAEAVARSHGWQVNRPEGYPVVACSERCWQREHDAWEAGRAAREALREELARKGRP